MSTVSCCDDHTIHCNILWGVMLMHYGSAKFQLRRRTKGSVQIRGLSWMAGNMVRFYGEELLTPRPTPELEDHPLQAGREYLLNIFAPTLHIGGRSIHPEPKDAPCNGDRDPLIGPMRDAVTGEWRNYIMRSLIVCTAHPILFGW